MVRSQSPVARRYVVGDSIRYHMVAVNAGHPDTVQYMADAAGRVTRDSAGRFVEALSWTNLVVNGRSVPLADAGWPATAQTLSLSPEWRATPNTRGLDPQLLAPVLDLLTFYVDLQLAARMSRLTKAGDHAYLPIAVSPTWGDGRTLLRGQDAIDFDLTLMSIDSTLSTADILVKHVPPAKRVIDFPAPWMEDWIGALPNNWLQLSKLANGGFLGAAGYETFDVLLTVSLRDGRLLRATMSNPVDVVERECADSRLTECAAPVRYRITRTIIVIATK